MYKRRKKKRSSAGRVSGRDLILLLLGAALYATAMPGSKYFPPWGAYFAFVPLFFCDHPRSWKRREFLLGFIFGTAGSFFLLRWVAFTVSVYGHLGSLAGLFISLLLSLYCGIYFAIFSLLMFRSYRRFGEWGLVAAPFYWSSIEILRSKAQEGFPWLLFGYSQYHDELARQFARMGGVIGIGFLLMSINVLAFVSIKALLRGTGKKSLLPLTFLACIVILLHLPGLLTGDESFLNTGSRKNMQILVVQPNIEQWKKWDKTFQEETVRTTESLTESKLNDDIDLVVWPETALPFFYYWDEKGTESVTNFIRKISKPLITGSPWAEGAEETRYYNTILLIAPDGTVQSKYDKMLLVPFGEYVPMRRILFFIDKITEGGEDFSSGKALVLLRWGEMKGIPEVCYEAIFPGHAREGAMMGGNLLLNLTNDAWFGDTAAPYQQLYMAAFRSVETGRFMIRSSNSGISAVIDRSGSVVKKVGLGKKASFVASVTLFSEMTFYVNNARVINLCISLIGILFIFITIFRRKRDVYDI